MSQHCTAPPWIVWGQSRRGGDSEDVMDGMLQNSEREATLRATTRIL